MAERFFDVETWYSDTDKTVAYVTLRGFGDCVVNHASDMKYEVVSGTGKFWVENTPTSPILVGPGDCVFIERGTAYEDQGDLVMLATSEPAFDPSAVEIIE